MKFWTYRYRFTCEDVTYKVTIASRSDGMLATLERDGAVLARDETLMKADDRYRNLVLETALPSGRTLSVEAGFSSWWTASARARVEGQIVFDSHPGRVIAFPDSAKVLDMERHYDAEAARRNRVPIVVDLVSGAIFFAVGWVFGLTTAALVGAGIGVALVIAQRFVKVDLLGGLALFGVAMLLASAGLALILDTELAVQLRTTIIGTVTATLFLLDGAFGGNWLGRGMARYIPYSDVDRRRLCYGVGILGLIMAALNLVVTFLASEQVWLIYSTFLDIPLIFVGYWIVIQKARAPAPTAA